jgi:hypothetical protein
MYVTYKRKTRQKIARTATDVAAYNSQILSAPLNSDISYSLTITLIDTFNELN